MEHIVQFGINIDDSAIQNMILNKASETVVREVKRELNVSDNFYLSPSNITKLVGKYMDDFLAENKDKIIAEASKQLADKMARTKAVKEAIGGVIECI